MKHAAAVLVATASMCLASIPPPFYYECTLVDRVGVSAKVGKPASSIALETLERIAEGRMADLSPGTEVQVGLEPGQLHKPEFKDETVRSHALRRIGEVDLPEALTYLQNLKKRDIQPDTSGQMWSSAQIALRQAQVNRVPDELEKISFLESVTSERGSAAAWWAVQELCNRGSYHSLAFISEHIRRAYSSPRDLEQAMGFCEARMAITSRDADRVKALGSFLTVSSGATDPELIGWAINELHSLDSASADAEVERYAREIESLPDGSALKTALWGKRVQIRNLLPHRPK
jgi:hypothetical protein